MKNPKGTKFEIKVWNYLKKIPKGKLRTYSQVAIAINKPLAVRAVSYTHLTLPTSDLV